MLFTCNYRAVDAFSKPIIVRTDIMTPPKKKILFVGYGNGHADMFVPILKQLHSDANIHAEALILTLGAAVFKRAGLSYRGYKDFLRTDDTQAYAWGEKLAAEFHNPASGIEEAESVAYLGLSYWDLVVRHGEEMAAKLWQEKGRHAFLQLTVLERVFDEVRPDFVVVTNSPKSEHAAAMVARQRGIPSLALVDLFGVHHYQALATDYVGVLCTGTINNLRSEWPERPDDSYWITGNPAFDAAFDYRGPADHRWRHTQFPEIADDKKIAVWLDETHYWDLEKRQWHFRSDAEIATDLDAVTKAAADNDCHLIVYPHPSQDTKLHQAWRSKHPNAAITLATGAPLLYPLLNIANVVMAYTSISMIEAVLMQRRVIQIKYYKDHTDMPLGAWGMAWLSDNTACLTDTLRDALHNDIRAQQMQQTAASIFPQQKAAPLIIERIKQILGVAVL